MEIQEKIIKFEDKVKSIYLKQAGSILENSSFERKRSFRINTLKADTDDTLTKLREEGIKFSAHLIPGAYILEDDSNLARSDVHKDRLTYIQELSSMLPVLELDPKSGERILDLCAAPGSKTSQIAALTNNEAEIVAVEPSRTRFFKMKQLMKNMGVNLEKAILSRGNVLYRKYPYVNYFNKVLVDAPCSNENRLNILKRDSFKFWNPKNSKSLSNNQKSLIAAGFTMLKPGGTLIYSTCTYSVEENEMVVDWLKRKFASAKVCKFESKEVLGLKNTRPGLTKYKKKEFDSEVSKTLRILPNEMYGAFFMAKICK